MRERERERVCARQTHTHAEGKIYQILLELCICVDIKIFLQQEKMKLFKYCLFKSQSLDDTSESEVVFNNKVIFFYQINSTFQSTP